VHIAIVKDLAAREAEQEAASSASSDVSLIKISSLWSNTVVPSIMSFSFPLKSRGCLSVGMNNTAPN
jgi:hypothetical protein